MRRNSPFNMLRSPHKDRLGYGNLIGDEELDEIAMAPQRKLDFLEKEVQPDDTLQSIALEFNVSVAELKRVNNIHKENEIHARNILKVPIKPHSLLLESKFFNDEDAIEMVSPTRPVTKADSEAAVLVDMVNKTTLTESVPVLPVTPLSSPVTPEEIDDETEVLLRTRVRSPDLSPLHCNGADGDLSWGFLLLLVIVIGIGGPILYIWYFWGHLEKIS